MVHPDDWLGKALDSAPLRLIGRLSYGLYLWQELLLTRVVPVPVAAKVALLLGIAALSYYSFEKRCVEFGRRLSKRFGQGGRVRLAGVPVAGRLMK